VIGVLSRATYVRGHALGAGVVVALGWLATTVAPLVLLKPDAADGPRTVVVLAGGTTLGLMAAAAVLVWVAGRSWGSAALALPTRALVSVVLGAVAGAGAGRWAGALAGGGSLATSAAAGLLAAVVALIVAALVAFAVDPSIRQRLRAARPHD
jgi:putative peptidoglycan lipid II flippase